MSRRRVRKLEKKMEDLRQKSFQAAVAKDHSLARRLHRQILEVREELTIERSEGS